MVVEGAEVRQTEQQLREEGAVVWPATANEGAQSFYEILLQLLHSPDLHDSRAICKCRGGIEVRLEEIRENALCLCLPYLQGAELFGESPHRWVDMKCSIQYESYQQKQAPQP